ncbi:MAG: hypothetical protein HYZ50_17425 [Deltaproteobacteria bacterium]|nr:hypothetical protein [Deltaproteobacteria bacterium]
MLGRDGSPSRPGDWQASRANEQLAIAGAACNNSPMGAITFDTLKFTKRLKEAGFTEPQAEAIADSFLQATGEVEVATKRDIERLEAKIERVEAKVVGVEGKVMGELTLVKWMLGLLLGGVPVPRSRPPLISLAPALPFPALPKPPRVA